ncbi:MAG TPA: M13 family metallopeptidase [Chitinophagales bacterium]|nr:M13 family metallopeptidase [Chitinophagales bacterium]
MNKSLQVLSIIWLITFTFFSCTPHEKTVSTSGCALDTFLNAYVDTTVKPQDDFFLFSMGKWVKNNPVPASERSWGIWSKVNEENYDRMKSINEEAAAKTAENGTNWQKIGDFWHTGMDTAAIEQQGIQPLSSELAKISALADVNAVIAEIGFLQSIGVGALFGSYIYQDEKNSEKMVLHLFQGGIGLPDRDYYFDNDERTKNIRSEYVKHITKMFALMGDDAATAEKNAATIMRLETSLAEKSRKLADLRDPYKNYNKMDMAGLGKMTPTIQWNNLLSASGIKSIDTVIVGQPEFFKRTEELVKKESIDNWKTYLRWNLINTYADKLSKPFDTQNFSFYGTVLNGTKEQRPRWKRVLDEEENLMGFMLGQLYVERYYSPKVKARYDKMVDNVVDAYRERINQLDWMSDATKQKAQQKLGTVMKKVGYPDKWRDYSSLVIDKSSYAENVMRATKWRSDYEIAKLNKPVDRTEWDMTPQTWNAYYNPSNNEIVLPAAAFIVPGMADSCVDDAIMYGYAAGSTIGHEITHGFDDQGSQFDEKGNLVEWWTKDDRTKFLEKTGTIVKQFNEFVVLDSLHVNGDATQGENIADLGGMLLGLDAFKKTEQYKSGEKIGGFTPVQRYFIGFALSWYGQYRPEALALRIKTDVHAPNFLRVNGPPVNIDEFYTAFNIQPGDKMYRPDSLRVRIW